MLGQWPGSPGRSRGRSAPSPARARARGTHGCLRAGSLAFPGRIGTRRGKVSSSSELPPARMSPSHRSLQSRARAEGRTQEPRPGARESGARGGRLPAALPGVWRRRRAMHHVGPHEERGDQKVPVQFVQGSAPLQAAVRSVHYGTLNLNEALNIKTSPPLGYHLPL